MSHDLDFQRVNPNALDEQGLICLDKALEVSYYGHTRESIWPLLEQGHFQVWEGKAENSHFVLLTELQQVVNLPKHILHIWTLGGRGYLKHIDKVYDSLLAWGKLHHKITHISGIVDRAWAEKKYKHFNPVEYKFCIMEVPNG